MKAILDVGVTSIHNFPVLTTGQPLRHSCLHFLGLHLSVDTMAILVFFDDVSEAAFLPLPLMVVDKIWAIAFFFHFFLHGPEITPRKYRSISNDCGWLDDGEGPRTWRGETRRGNDVDLIRGKV